MSGWAVQGQAPRWAPTASPLLIPRLHAEKVVAGAVSSLVWDPGFPRLQAAWAVGEILTDPRPGRFPDHPSGRPDPPGSAEAPLPPHGASVAPGARELADPQTSCCASWEMTRRVPAPVSTLHPHPPRPLPSEMTAVCLALRVVPAYSCPQPCPPVFRPLCCVSRA